ncbi:hypothetical protein [Lentzea albida]|uniref:hypothetical protein n=1 Tax=Lentzea albida TaxID=65499 RepID=UPI0011603102|nr:hypothetical protein [Lentzea albida]
MNPQIGFGALVIAFLGASVRIYRHRSRMDPELARVRALEKVINRTLPRFGRNRASSGDDCLKSAISALTTPTSVSPVSEEPEDEAQNPAAEDGQDDPPVSGDP